MKKTIRSFVSAAVLLVLLAGCADGNKNQTNEKQETAMSGELKAFDVQKDFADNGFTFFNKGI